MKIENELKGEEEFKKKIFQIEKMGLDAGSKLSAHLAAIKELAEKNNFCFDELLFEALRKKK